MKNFLLLCVTTLLITSCAGSPISQTSQAQTLSSEIPATIETPTSQTGNASKLETLSSPTAVTPFPVTSNEVEETAKELEDYFLLQNYIPALAAYFGDDWSKFSVRGLDYDTGSNQIAISGCISECDRYLEGYPVLLMMDAEQNTAPRSLKIDYEGEISDLDFTLDGTGFIYSTRQGIMKFDLSTEKSQTLWNKTQLNYPPINDISPDGKYLAADINKSLVIFDLATMQEVVRFPEIYVSAYHANYFSDASNRGVFSRDRDFRQFIVFDVPTWKVVQEFNFPEVSLTALSPEGNWLASAERDSGMVTLINLSNGTQTWQRETRLDRVYALVFAPDGRLFISGSPDDNTSMFETTLILDATTGVETGNLLYYSDFYHLQFINNGSEILALSAAAFGLWGADTDQIRKVTSYVQDYFAAINNKDYRRAAQMTALDELALAEVRNLGLDPSNMVTVFEKLCTDDEVPCLPLAQVGRINASDGEYWDYEVLVALLQPDGEVFRFDGIEPYEYMGVKIDPQGNLRIATLHPGMRYPFR